jgi:hypothetical protein
MDHQFVDRANPAAPIAAVIAALASALADRRNVGNANVLAGAAVLVHRFFLRLAGRMADGLHPAAALWAVTAAVIAAPVAHAIATGVARSLGTASGFGRARFAGHGECLSDQRNRADESKSDRSKEISFHVYCLLIKALEIGPVG